MKTQFTFLCFLILCYATEVMACTCNKFNLTEEELDRYEFIAHVKTDSIYASTHKKISARDFFFDVSFKIKKLYKGKSRKSIMVYGAHPSIHRGWTSCDMGIEEGEEWVLMAYRDRFGRLQTNSCEFNIRHKNNQGEINTKSNAFQEAISLLDKHYTLGAERKVLDGHIESRYPDGKIEKEEYYQNGELEGNRNTYHKNGLLMLSESYRNGKLHGKQLNYHSSGQLSWEYNYKNGLPIDTCYVYTSLGTLSNTRIYSHKGQLLSDHEYYPADHLKSKLTHDTLTRRYTKTTYYDSGTVKDHNVFQELGHEIAFKRFYESGKLKHEIIYFPEDSTLRHIKKSWSETGVLIEHKVFKTGSQMEVIIDKERKNPDH